MSCLQHCYGRPGGYAHVARDDETSVSTRGTYASLSGTWDFKWPIGTVIRVAYQQLPSDVDPKLFEQGTFLVERKLDAWLRQPGKEPNLDYRIVGTMPAPPLARSGWRPAKSVGGEVEYDVLITFLPLPVVLPSTEQHPEEFTVTTSASELGRYARRIEYGVPTTYLGPWYGFDSASWLTSPEGEFAVVHELGHVLGMPHEQQNPSATALPWKSKDEMIALLQDRSGLSPGADLDAFIENEIVGRWPGELRFSDWRETAANPPDYDFDSVMAKPSYQCLLKDVHDPNRCTATGCEILEEALRALRLPTQNDLVHLTYMYGAKPAHVGSESYPVRVELNALSGSR